MTIKYYKGKQQHNPKYITKHLDTNKYDIKNMLSKIISEKKKLEDLTKKIIHKQQNTTPQPQPQPKQQPQQLQQPNPTSNINTTQNTTKNQTPVSKDDIIKNKETLEQIQKSGEQLNIKASDFKNVAATTVSKILELLKNYVNMDKTFRVKHESLKELYKTYLELYKKYKDNKQQSSSNMNTINIQQIQQNQQKQQNQQIQNIQQKLEEPNDMQHQHMHNNIIKDIHKEMKDNNTNLYKERLIILKKIKEEPEINKELKDNICGRLMVIFKSPPISEYSQLPMLQNSIESKDTSNNSDKDNDTSNDTGKNAEKATNSIHIKELDEAYLQKHNELMTVYKAYQGLFNKVLNYKDELDKYKQLPTTSTISRPHMDKLISDQGFVMEMIDKMQDKLIAKNIISNSEKVPVNPVASNPTNIGSFNNTMRDQIRTIIDRQGEINPITKQKLNTLLNKYQDCDSNDKFCQAGRKLILIKKM